MVKKQEPLLDHIQVVLYTSSLDLSKPLELALRLKNTHSLGLDGQEIIFPIPPDAPLEIPIIVLADKKKAITCQIATNRVDLFITPPKENIVDNQNLKALIHKLQSILNIIKSKFGAKINRIALVLQTVTTIEGSSIDVFKDKYIKIALGNTVDTAEISFLNKNALGKFKVNKWTRIRTLKKTDQDNYLQLVFDINTLQENDYNFDNAGIEEFVNLAKNDVIHSLPIVLSE